MPRMIDVVIIDDHPVTRRGVSHLIGRWPNYAVVADAASPEEGLAVLETSACDVILTDLVMPSTREPDGIYFVIKLRALYPETGIAVLTAATSQHLLRALWQSASVSIVDKGTSEAGLRAAMDAAARRAPYVTPAVRRILDATALPGSDGQVPGALSAREVEVVRLLHKGIPSWRIAELFGTSPKTVSRQKMSAMKKLGAVNTRELLHAATGIGIVDPM